MQLTQAYRSQLVTDGPSHPHVQHAMRARNVKRARATHEDLQLCWQLGGHLST